MTESRAWLLQIDSDWEAAFVLSEQKREPLFCQEVAKYQQIVEKSIRAIESLLLERRLINQRAKFEHHPGRAINSLLILPKIAEGISKVIVRRVLSKRWLTEIHDICRLAPKLPADGTTYRMNTEYPYNIGVDWTAPAAAGNYTTTDIDRFRIVASHMRASAHQIYSAYNRLENSD